MQTIDLYPHLLKNSDANPLFESIVDDIYQQGFSIQPNALPDSLSLQLLQQLKRTQQSQFKQAGIGRGDFNAVNDFVRKDKIFWLEPELPEYQEWFLWTEALKAYLNRELFLGLQSIESHFAHYEPNDFYKKHLDAFKGDTNRKLSLVTYLNPNWQPHYGGELVIYPNDDNLQAIKVTPQLGTIAIFLSEDFPHEVLPATQNRYSIASWFSVNPLNPLKLI